MAFFIEDLSKKSLIEIRANQDRLDKEIVENLSKLNELKSHEAPTKRLYSVFESTDRNTEIAEIESAFLKNIIEKYTGDYTEAYTYYKNLSKQTYIASIIAMFIGMIFALNFIPVIFFNSDKDQTFATSVAALIIVSEIIAALFFAFHKITLEQATFYFEKMENMKQKALGLWLAETIKDPAERIKLLVEIAKSFIKKSEDMT